MSEFVEIRCKLSKHAAEKIDQLAARAGISSAELVENFLMRLVERPSAVLPPRSIEEESLYDPMDMSIGDFPPAPRYRGS